MTPVYALQRPVLLFSNLCRICRWAARIVEEVDPRNEMTLLPLEHDDADTLLASIPEERRTDCWWLVLRDGSPIRGDRSGALLLLVALWLSRPIGRVPTPLRVTTFLDTLGESVAEHRSRRRDGRALRSPTTAG